MVCHILFQISCFTGVDTSRLTPPGKAAFSTADVGQMVTIQGDHVKVDGQKRFVEWSQAAHSDCSGKIESVDGKVRLESGEEFENPETSFESKPDNTSVNECGDFDAILRLCILCQDRS